MSASEWDQHYESGETPWENGLPSSELQRVIAEEQIRPCRVFEAGCGSGINAVWLAEQGFDVTGVDFTPLAIEKARQRAESAGVTVRFVLADVLALPEGLGTFPFVFDRGCYHCVRRIDVQAYVESLKRVTGPGSLGLILTGNAKEPSPEGQGPPIVAEEDFHAELEPAFEIVRLREFYFDGSPQDKGRHLAWSCLIRRSGDDV